MLPDSVKRDLEYRAAADFMQLVQDFLGKERPTRIDFLDFHSPCMDGPDNIQEMGMHEGFATRKLYPLHAAGGSFINEPLAFFPGEFRFPGTILSPVVTMPATIAAAFRD